MQAPPTVETRLEAVAEYGETTTKGNGPLRQREPHFPYTEGIRPYVRLSYKEKKYDSTIHRRSRRTDEKAGKDTSRGSERKIWKTGRAENVRVVG